jgi:hypothetical protein
LGFLEGDNVRQALSLRRLDKIKALPGLMQHIGRSRISARKDRA